MVAELQSVVADLMASIRPAVDVSERDGVRPLATNSQRPRGKSGRREPLRPTRDSSALAARPNDLVASGPRLDDPPAATAGRAPPDHAPHGEAVDLFVDDAHRLNIGHGSDCGHEVGDD